MTISKEFIPLFFGNGYELCNLLFLILIPTCLFQAISNVIRTQILIPYGYDRIFVKSTVFGLFTSILLNLILIPPYGAIGASISTIITEVFVCFYQYSFASKYFPMYNILRKCFPFFASGIIMFLSTYFFEPSFGGNIQNLIIKIAMAVIIYVSALAFQMVIFKDNLEDIICYVKNKLSK